MTEGLDDTDPSSSALEDDTEDSPPPNNTSDINTNNNNNSLAQSTTDLCKNNNNSTLSLTDKNLLFLNDRINILNTNYLDLSMNLIKLENQLKDNATQSADEAKDLVGDTPIEVT